MTHGMTRAHDYVPDPAPDVRACVDCGYGPDAAQHAPQDSVRGRLLAAEHAATMQLHQLAQTAEQDPATARGIALGVTALQRVLAVMTGHPSARRTVATIQRQAEQLATAPTITAEQLRELVGDL